MTVKVYSELYSGQVVIMKNDDTTCLYDGFISDLLVKDVNNLLELEILDDYQFGNNCRRIVLK